MKNKDLLLLLGIGASVVVIWHFARKKKTPQVGGISDISAYGRTAGIRTIAQAAEILLNATKDTSINNDVFAVTDKEGTKLFTTKEIALQLGRPTEISTKQHLYEALSVSKRNENILLQIEFQHIRRDTESASEILRKIRRDFIEPVKENGARSEEEAYLLTLDFISSGGKFRWYDEGEKRGVQNLLLGKRRQGRMLVDGGKQRAERKEMHKIMNDKQGEWPEDFAQRIGRNSENYTADDNLLLNGVLSAISEVASPAEARDAIVYMYGKSVEDENARFMAEYGPVNGDGPF